MSDDKIITVRPDYTLQAIQLTGDPAAREVVQGWALTTGATFAEEFFEGAEEGKAWILFREAHPRQLFMQYPEDFVTFFDPITDDETPEVDAFTLSDEDLRKIVDGDEA